MAKQDNKPNLNELKTFYDPHPGLAGALLPIPVAVRLVAEELNGQTMTLTEALTKIRAVTKGRVEVVPKHNFISLVTNNGLLTNMYRVIRYK